eukprot:TRINITY_DN150_c0_g1_i1.p2 TRINITY_DN150_c0_g1~~TRINITY_DN150_c0_g1_i1.p2  ORF type:complete len:168 (+),score=31.15 TRINITY_DN150_c0_g1_i1:52-504(+)
MSHLLWNTLRNTSSFAVKRDGVVFSRDKRNVSAIHSYTYNPSTNSRNVYVTANKKGASLIVKQGNGRRPASQNKSVKLNKHFRASAKTIRGVVGNVRPQLVGAALRRYSRLSECKKSKPKAAKSQNKQRKARILAARAKITPAETAIVSK